MAMRTTSKKVAEAIRDDVNEWVRDYAELTDMPPGCEPTPWAVYQEIKHQMAYEFARFGQIRGHAIELAGAVFRRLHERERARAAMARPDRRRSG